MNNFVPLSPPISSVAARQSNVPLLALHAAEPIRVAHKPKHQTRYHNIFYDDIGFPDQSDEFDYLLHSVDGGPLLRKSLHPAPNLDSPVDPHFLSAYNLAIHKNQLREKLNLSHLPLDVQDQIYSLIQEFWSVFDSKGVTVPVKSYECIIDTGSARPIAIKKINYGDNKTAIMWECIAALAKVGHIRQIHDGKWLFKALLAPKPHQENVHDINNFVWQFCINYIPFNGLTCVIAFPIPQCNSAVYSKFRGQRMAFMWLWDAPQGYHQLRVALCSQPKLAFQGTDAMK